MATWRFTLGLLLLLPAALGAQALKIGYVDTERILNQAPGKEEANKILQEEITAWRGEAEAKMKELQALKDEYESQRLILSPDKRKEKEDAIAAKEKEFNDLWLSLQDRAQKRSAELTQPILEKVDRAIKTVAERESYTLVLDASQGALVYASKDLDVTDDVIEELARQTPR